MAADREPPHDKPQTLWQRRAVLRSLVIGTGGGIGALYLRPAPAAAADRLAAISTASREKAMRRAIAVAKRNPTYPFGAVITRIAGGQMVAEGVNASGTNPMLHGEVAAMNDYLHRHGNKDWAEMVLYTTAEPCAMCMSALVWAGIGGVIFGTSLAGLKHAGIDQIDIPAQTIAAASPFWHGEITGGVLANETDALFAHGRKS
ncbi:MAG TPA: nucleoside deaminase [Stellaceae bacterium]|jgi:tRNA(Arg) A34 adenosine deaminase TadA|nr:nucleoside deaminase [Stellaceae bacterium]